MRGGRNKFGPIYRRDRDLRRQLRNQLRQDANFDVVAKAAAEATLAQADLDAVAKVAATATVDGLTSYSVLVSHPSGMDADVKPDVVELCRPASQGNDAPTTNRAQLNSTAAASLTQSSVQSSYLTTSTSVSDSAACGLSTASDPISGLSGMAAALLSQFLQQQQRHFVPQTRTTSALTGVPRIVAPTLTTTMQNVVVVSSQVASSSQPPGGTLAPRDGVTQYFNTRPASASRPVTPHGYVIPVVQNLSSPNAARQPLHPAIHTVSHPVTPQQSVISVGHVVTPQQSLVCTVHTVSHPATPRQSVMPTVHAVSHPATPNQPVIPTVHAATPQQFIIPTVHITPDVSESVDVSRIHDVPPPAPAPPPPPCGSGELQWSSLELDGVPATLRLIFDLKRQTASSVRLTEGGPERLRTFVEHLLQQPVTSVTSSLETAIQRAVALACRVGDQQLFLLVDWARQAHFFRHLAVSPL